MDKKFTRRQIVRSAAAGLLFTVTPAAFAKSCAPMWFDALTPFVEHLTSFLCALQ